MRRYLRDVADHQTEAADQIASYDDMLNSLVQAALARVGMQQNTDMRKISAWAGIVAVPTMIAGIYGMNFEFMPELKWHWSYPVVVAVMATSCLFLYSSFRKQQLALARSQARPYARLNPVVRHGVSDQARRRRRSATPVAWPRRP